MSPPSQGTVQAAIQSLRDDAQTWRTGAGELRAAAGVAAGMDLQAFHFSYLGDKVGLTDSYRALQDKLVDLFHGGAANFTDVADALTTAADGYQADETNAVHRMRNIW